MTSVPKYLGRPREHKEQVENQGSACKLKQRFTANSIWGVYTVVGAQTQAVGSLVGASGAALPLWMILHCYLRVRLLPISVSVLFRIFAVSSVIHGGSLLMICFESHIVQAAPRRWTGCSIKKGSPPSGLLSRLASALVSMLCQFAH